MDPDTVQRGNVKIDNRRLLNARLYIAENGGKWRRLPKEYGNWHTIYTRLRRWDGQGVLERIFEALQRQRLIAIRIDALLWITPASRCIQTPWALSKKRAAGDRQIRRRTEHQNSYNRRG
jgi:transposase